MGEFDEESWEEELLDLLMNPSTLFPFTVLLTLLMLLPFWYRWGDFKVFGGVAIFFVSSQTVIATCTFPFPSKMSDAQHSKF